LDRTKFYASGSDVSHFDYFLIVAQTKELTDYYLKTFLHICKEIGIPMAPDKTIGPDTSVTFSGIERGVLMR
jgi:hypothetical protein